MAKAQQVNTTSTRQPIVAILGHVDHGKTTLLDYIRKTHLQSKEVGGITQSIGAYQAEFQGKRITFIDTPGHAAFSNMRSRGATVADIGVLVVAADDGVKPQTIESIKHLKSASLPFVVALNKIDAPGSSPETAKAQLTEHEVFVEGYGGNNPVVEISAKNGKNIDSLLENILLLAELEEIEADPSTPLEGVVIEVVKDRKSGILVNAIIMSGSLALQAEISTDSARCKVKALFNENKQVVKEVLPGEPVQILGFKSPPQVGEIIRPATTESPEKVHNDQGIDLRFPPEPVENKLNLILKADTEGSLEAIKNSLSDDVNIVHSGTGDINDSDITLANATGSIVTGFNTRLTNSIKSLAADESVTVKVYRIIYELLDYVEKKVLRILEPTIDEETLGEAKIVALFEIDSTIIAGCTIESGIITTGDKVHLKRKDKIIKDSRVKSIRIGKEEVKKISAGKECGILLAPQLDIRKNDSIISYNKNKEEE